MVCLSALSISSYAKLARIDATDSRGDSLVIYPAAQETIYMSPQAGEPFSVFLSGGTDEKIRIEVKKKDQGLLFRQETGVINYEDTTTINGVQHYGQALKIERELVDGEYVIDVIRNRTNGLERARNTYALVVDTQPPEYEKLKAHHTSGGGYRYYTLPDGRWLVQKRSVRNTIFIEGLSDSLSGVGSAVLESVEKIGEGGEKTILKNDVPLTLSLEKGTAEVKAPNVFKRDGAVSDINLNFAIYDKAGNKKTITQGILADFQCQVGDFVGIESETPSDAIQGFAGYKPYTPGVTVTKNPFRLLYRLPKEDDYRSGALLGVNPASMLGRTLSRTEKADYVYYEYEALQGTTYIRHSKKTAYRCKSIRPNVSLSPDANGTPKIRSALKLFVSEPSAEDPVSDYGSYRRIRSSYLPGVMKHMRVKVEPQSYEQEVVFSAVRGNSNTCLVPAGEDSCDIPLNIEAKKGTMGYFHSCCSATGGPSSYSGPYPGRHGGSLIVRSSSQKRLKSKTVYARSFWNDRVIPEIKGFSLEKGSLVLSYTTPGDGFAQGSHRYRKEVVMLEVDGETHQLKDKTRNEVSDFGQRHDMAFSLEDIPSGNVTATATIATTTGSEVSEEITFTVDNDGPELTLGGLAGHIQNTESATLTMSEPSYFSEPTVTLSGGPSSINTTVPLSGGGVSSEDQPSDTYLYSLNVPILYPSDDKPYTVTASATDKHGNSTTMAQTFYYSPPKIGLSYGDTSYIPAGAPALVNDLGDPAIQSKVFKRDGVAVSGTYPLWAFVAEDADGAVTINGVTVPPGETVQVKDQHSFSESSGKVMIPMSIPSGVKQADILVYAPVTDMPMLAFTVKATKPVVNIRPDSEDATIMFPYSLRVSRDTLNDGCAPFFDSESNHVSAMENLFKLPVCLVQWPKSLSPGVVGYDSILGELTMVPEQAKAYQLTLPITVPLQNGKQYPLGETQFEFEAVEAVTEIDYEATSGEIDRSVQESSIKLLDPSYCRLTEDPGLASQKPLKYCVAEFTNLPDSWYSARRNEVSRNGYLNEEGDSYTASWRIGRISESGQPVWFAEQNHVFDLKEPEKPVIARKYGIEEAENVYANPGVTSQRIISFQNLSLYPVDMVVEMINGKTLRYESVTPLGIRTMPGIEAPLWSELTHDFRASYTKSPDRQKEDQFASIVMPDNYLKVQMLAPSVITDTAPLDLEVNIGRMKGGGYSFEPETMGDWSVYLAEIDKAGQSTPVTGRKPAADGALTFTVPADVIAKNKSSYIKLEAVAELKPPADFEDYSRYVTSFARNIRIEKGTKLEGTLTSRMEEGPAPFTSLVQVDMERASRYALETIEWQKRKAGASTWEDLSDQDGRRNIYLHVEKGHTEVRAKLVNRHTSVVSYTDPLTLWAYPELAVEVDGPGFVAFGDTAKLTIRASEDGFAVPGSSIATKWEYKDPMTRENVSGETQSKEIHFDNDRRLRVNFKAHARHKDASSESVRSWFSTHHYVQFDTLRAPRVSAYIPYIIELGKSYDLEANIRPQWGRAASDYELATEWELPNGKIVTGEKVNMILDDEENAHLVDSEESLYITVRSWIKGHKSKTLAEKRRSVSVWRYTWPDFNIRVRNNHQEVPASISATVQPASSTWYREVKNEQLEYIWDIPGEAEDVGYRTGGSTVRFNLPEGTGGKYPITVTIKDNRGNQTTATTTAVLGDTPSYDISLMSYPDNRYWRAPLELYVRSSAANGHRKDRPEIYEWYVDGIKVEGEDRYISRLPIETPGNHEIMVKMRSKLGKESTATEVVTAYPNKPPSCEMRVTDYSTGSTLVYASCRDEDGRISSYDWKVNGNKISTTSNRITVPQSNSPQSVELLATDDAGGMTTGTATVKSKD